MQLGMISPFVRVYEEEGKILGGLDYHGESHNSLCFELTIILSILHTVVFNYTLVLFPSAFLARRACGIMQLQCDLE